MAMDVRLGDDALLEAVAAVRRAQDSMDAARSRAASRVEMLLDGGWSGRAASAFENAWRDWLEGSALVARGLAETSEALAAIDVDFATTDRAIADRAAVLTERLG